MRKCHKLFDFCDRCSAAEKKVLHGSETIPLKCKIYEVSAIYFVHLNGNHECFSVNEGNSTHLKINSLRTCVTYFIFRPQNVNVNDLEFVNWQMCKRAWEENDEFSWEIQRKKKKNNKAHKLSNLTPHIDSVDLSIATCLIIITNQVNAKELICLKATWMQKTRIYRYFIRFVFGILCLISISVSNQLFFFNYYVFFFFSLLRCIHFHNPYM